MSHGLFPHLLFAWSWTAHHELTVAAITLAVKSLDARGVLKRLAVTASDFKSRLSSLWAMDNCQDITIGNLVPTVGDFLGHLPLIGGPLRGIGVCGVEVPGGQVTHFMRDQRGSGADAHVAYRDSYMQIEKTAIRAWELFRKAFPPPEPEHHHHGLLGALEKVYEYSPVGLAVTGVKAIVHEEEKLGGEYFLGRALHTLQDSYSPAHTLRLFNEPWTIVEIFAYSEDNRDPHPGFPGHPEKDWPGHTILDHPNTNSVSPPLCEQAKLASADLIVAVLGNLFTDGGCFTSELKQVLWKRLAWRF